jgi:hypothetical protein
MADDDATKPMLLRLPARDITFLDAEAAKAGVSRNRFAADLISQWRETVELEASTHGTRRLRRPSRPVAHTAEDFE